MSCHTNTPISEKKLGDMSCELEITLTLLPKHYVKSVEEQAMLARESLLEIMKKIQCKAIFVLEITKQYNIHIHGMLQLPKVYQDPLKTLFQVFRTSKVFGRKTIQQVRYYDSYVEYMVKDIEKTRTVINLWPIIRDDYNLYNSYSEYMFKKESGNNVVS